MFTETSTALKRCKINFMTSDIEVFMMSELLDHGEESRLGRVAVGLDGVAKEIGKADEGFV